ncbi:hypothetical protein LTR97_012096 [Elasticomyces elasticus]|uniref:Uncharacterized protein n=1 Tax=Elasticomyces elasticus TaxID=574655 RepID=A0AAN7ZV73_9PEZI|nr:hypothetical protein LTR97_012096 [Elasticomyces elasticus]
MTGNWDDDNAGDSEVLPIVRRNARSHPANLGLWNVRLGTLVIDIDDLTVLYLRLSLTNVLTAGRPTRCQSLDGSAMLPLAQCYYVGTARNHCSYAIRRGLERAIRTCKFSKVLHAEKHQFNPAFDIRTRRYLYKFVSLNMDQPSDQHPNKRPHPDNEIPHHLLQQCKSYTHKAIKIEHGIELPPIHTMSDHNDLRASSAGLGDHGLPIPMHHAVDAPTLPAAETFAIRHVQSSVDARPEQEPEAVQDTTLSLYMSTLKHFDSSNPMYTIAVSQVLDYARNSPERVDAILTAVQKSGLRSVKTTPIVDAIAGVKACHSAAALASTVSSFQDLTNVLRAFYAGLPGTLQSSFSAAAAVNAGGTSDCSQALAVSQPLSPASSQSRSDSSDPLSVTRHGQVPATVQPRRTTPSAKMESTPAPAPISAIVPYSHDLPALPAPILITWIDTKPRKGTFQAIYTVNAPNAPFSISKHELMQAVANVFGDDKVLHQCENANYQLWLVSFKNKKTVQRSMTRSVPIRDKLLTADRASQTPPTIFHWLTSSHLAVDPASVVRRLREVFNFLPGIEVRPILRADKMHIFAFFAETPKLYSFFLPLHVTIGGRTEIEQAWFRPWHGMLKCEGCVQDHSWDHVCEQAEKVRVA